MGLDYSKKDNSRVSEVAVLLQNGNKIQISSAAVSPDTTLSLLVKAVSAQVIFESNYQKRAPNEIWTEVEKLWDLAKASADNYKVVSNRHQTGPARVD